MESQCVHVYAQGKTPSEEEEESPHSKSKGEEPFAKVLIPPSSRNAMWARKSTKL